MHRGYLVNSSVGEYHVVDFLGAGGMGEVYRAVHAKIGRAVAIKVLTEASLSGGMIERFFNEARIQASLQHPNLATLYDFLEFNGQPCIIMEYIDGQTLAERIRPAGPLPLAETIEIFRTVVEAVGHLHKHGIIHRDIKSNNIKISSSGQVKLLDFGLAKGQMSPGLTATGSVIGTLEYISPEQLRLGVADTRSDIWALGVLLYEMATGHMPFEANTLGEMCEKINKVAYRPPIQLNPHVAPQIAAIISRCLKKSPADRYQSSQDLLQDMARLDRPPASPARAKSLLTRRGSERSAEAISWAKRHWKLLAAMSGAAIMLLIFTVGIYLAATGGPAETTQGQMRTIQITTPEGKADVYRDGQLIGTTPYEINARLEEQVNLILKRPGYADEKVDFKVSGQKKTITVTMRKE